MYGYVWPCMHVCIICDIKSCCKSIFQVAMVELNLGADLPFPLVMTFSLLTTCLISVHVFALMISVCILPNIETVENIHTVEVSKWQTGQGVSHEVKANESPHENLRKYIETAWIFSTGLGTLLFLLEIPVILWVKLYTINFYSAVAASAVMVPTSIIFVLFAVHFYRKLIKHEVVQRTKGLLELQYIAKQLGTEDVETGLNNQPLISDIKNF